MSLKDEKHLVSNFISFVSSDSKKESKSLTQKIRKRKGCWCFTNRVFLFKLSQKLRLILILLIQVLISPALELSKYFIIKSNFHVLTQRVWLSARCSFSSFLLTREVFAPLSKNSSFVAEQQTKLTFSVFLVVFVLSETPLGFSWTRFLLF